MTSSRLLAVTRSELEAALKRMSADDLALLKAIIRSDSPTAAREASTFVEVFHCFPIGIEGEGQIRAERVARDLPHLDPPEFVRADVQRAWEAFA